MGKKKSKKASGSTLSLNKQEEYVVKQALRIINLKNIAFMGSAVLGSSRLVIKKDELSTYLQIKTEKSFHENIVQELDQFITKKYVYSGIESIQDESMELEILVTDFFDQYPHLNLVYYAMIIMRCRMLSGDSDSILNREFPGYPEFEKIYATLQVFLKFLTCYPQIQSYMTGKNLAFEAVYELRYDILISLACLRKFYQERYPDFFELFNQLFSSYKTDIDKHDQRELVDQFEKMADQEIPDLTQMFKAAGTLRAHTLELTMSQELNLHSEMRILMSLARAALRLSVHNEAMLPMYQTFLKKAQSKIEQSGSKEAFPAYIVIPLLSHVVDYYSRASNDNFSDSLTLLCSLLSSESMVAKQEEKLVIREFLNKINLTRYNRKMLLQVELGEATKSGLAEGSLTQKDTEQKRSLREIDSELAKLKNMANAIKKAEGVQLSQATRVDQERQIRKRQNEAAASGTNEQEATTSIPSWEQAYRQHLDKAADFSGIPDYSRALYHINFAIILAESHEAYCQCYAAKVIGFFYRLNKLDHLLKKINITKIKEHFDHHPEIYQMGVDESVVKINVKEAYKLVQFTEKYSSILKAFSEIKTLSCDLLNEIEGIKDKIFKKEMVGKLKKSPTLQEIGKKETIFFEAMAFIKKFCECTWRQYEPFYKKKQAAGKALKRAIQENPFYQFRALSKEMAHYGETFSEAIKDEDDFFKEESDEVEAVSLITVQNDEDSSNEEFSHIMHQAFVAYSEAEYDQASEQTMKAMSVVSNQKNTRAYRQAYLACCYYKWMALQSEQQPEKKREKLGELDELINSELSELTGQEAFQDFERALQSLKEESPISTILVLCYAHLSELLGVSQKPQVTYDEMKNQSCQYYVALHLKFTQEQQSFIGCFIQQNKLFSPQAQKRLLILLSSLKQHDPALCESLVNAHDSGLFTREIANSFEELGASFEEDHSFYDALCRTCQIREDHRFSDFCDYEGFTKISEQQLSDQEKKIVLLFTEKRYVKDKPSSLDDYAMKVFESVSKYKQENKITALLDIQILDDRTEMPRKAWAQPSFFSTGNTGSTQAARLFL